MVVRVFLQESYAGWLGAYKKLRIRGSIDYPLAGVAVALKQHGTRVEDARVAITAVNPAPYLFPEAPHALIGRPVNEHSAIVGGELAAQPAKPLTPSALTPENRRARITLIATRAV